MNPLSRICAASIAASVVFLSSCGSPDTATGGSAGEPFADSNAWQDGAPAPGSDEWIDSFEQQVAAIGQGQPAPSGAAQDAWNDWEDDWSAEGSAPAPVSAPVAAPVTSMPTGDDLDAIAAASRERASLIDGRVAALVAKFVDDGMVALESGDIDAARESFGHALELDPGDSAIRALYQQTGALLGDQAAELGVASREARQRFTLKQQQALALVQHNVSRGRAALAAKNPDAAITHFEDALTLLRRNPDIANATLREDDLRALVSEAEMAANQLDDARQAELADRARQAQYDLETEQATQLERRLRTLLDRADDQFLAEEFAEAETTLREVLRVDPGNVEAERLLDITNRARHGQTARRNREQYRREWQRTFDEMENDMMPPAGLINFPSEKEWAAKIAAGGKSFGNAGRTESPADTAVRRRLNDTRIPTAYEDATLEEIVDNLSQITGVNFLYSQSVQDELFDLPPYTLQDRAEQPVSRILKILLEDLTSPQLSYEVRDGVVRVILAEEERNDYVLEFYDIRDLTVIPTDYASQDFNLLPSSVDAESFVGNVEDEEPLPFIGEDSLLSLITDNLAVDSWSDDPNRTIQLMPGMLVVRQTPDVHGQIRDLLSDLRRNTTTMIRIETRFLEVEDSFLEDIGVDLRGLDNTILEDFGTSGVGFGTPLAPSGIGTDNEAGFFYEGTNGDLKGRVENLFDVMLGDEGTLVNSGGLSLQALFLDDADINAVLRAVTKYQTSNIVNAPSLTLRSGQRGVVEVLTTRTYVRDFEPEIAQAAVIAQPELDNVSEGIVLDVRAVASQDRRFVTLEIRPTLAELVPGLDGDPLPSETVSVAGGNASDVTIQLPQLRIQRLRTTATVPDGATLLLGGLKKSVEQDLDSGVPFLSDIPILSFMFSRKGEYVSQQKILILLTAKVLVPEEFEPEFDNN